MYRHTPTCLRSSVPRNRLSWLFVGGERPLTETSPSREDIRLDLVERARREIAEGSYETPEKWGAALDRLAERLA